MTFEVPQTNLEKTLKMRVDTLLLEMKSWPNELRANARGKQCIKYYEYMARWIEKEIELIENKLPKVKYEEIR